MKVGAAAALEELEEPEELEEAPELAIFVTVSTAVVPVAVTFEETLLVVTELTVTGALKFKGN